MNNRKQSIIIDIKKIGLILFFVFISNLFYAQYNEYEVKAVMIGKFTLFIDWPEQSLKNSKEFNICLYGNRELTLIFKRIYKSKKIKNLPVKITNISSVNKNIEKCNLLYIKNYKKKRVFRILKRLKGKPVFIVSDNKSLTSKGAHIGFYLFENKIRFKINYKSIKESKIFVSYLLLRAGEVIDQ